jgi:hypothetical protein
MLSAPTWNHVSTSVRQRQQFQHLWGLSKARIIKLKRRSKKRCVAPERDARGQQTLGDRFEVRMSGDKGR